jgi:putative ABC transport system permease protein
MIKNFFLVTIRNIFRNKAFSIINILGLSLGMACSLLIFLWVHDERSVDTFNTNKNVYGVYERMFSGGRVDAGYYSPGLLAPELKRVMPQIQYAAGFWSMDPSLFETGEKKQKMNGAYAGADFFNIFSYKLLKGEAATALSGPENIALSRKMAEDFFGSPGTAIGKTIRFNHSKDFMVTAVFENVPANSSNKFDYLVNWKYLMNTDTWLNQWIYGVPQTFITLRPGTDPQIVETKIKNFITPYLAGKEGEGFRLELGLQRFDKMYLYSNFSNGKPDGGRIEYVTLFSIIAVFILLIACINFMNLATARSVKRAKEVGIRKTVGALRTGLIVQFIGEAMLLTFLSVVVALVIVINILPWFNILTGKQIGLPVSSIFFWLSVSALLLVTGIVAGSYPAFFLSSLNPVKVLKGALKFSTNALVFRKGLVVFQFVLSIVLIIGTIVVSKQVNYIQTKNLGFDKENLVYIPLEDSLQANYPVFKQELSQMTGIKSITRSTSLLTQADAQVHDLDWIGKNPNTKILAKFITVGYDYFKTMDLTLLQGRDFSPGFPDDTVSYVINESALKMIGYKNPVGQPLTFFGHRGKIIGIVKDFNFKSLHDPIEPLIFQFREAVHWGGSVIIRTEPGKTGAALANMEKVYKKLNPGYPFTYQFSDEEYRKLYNNEQLVSKLADGFSFLAIFISCLGLLGLTMFTAEQRRKEIGVRKVIGATVSDIVIMLSKEIIKLVIISALLAIPVAWLAMNNWLQAYAYRITISWWIFIAATLLAVLISLATISFQAIKSALANPVKSLKTE